ncbi:MAG: alpha/beta fold hydrolase [Actinobacteria bacterium]|nr:alpha/beta fold hydrolase [Actinomycetota bacterium]
MKRPGPIISKRRRKTSILAIIVLILMGTFSVQRIEGLPRSLAEYQSQRLSWSACYENFDCSYLQVPIDYKNLSLGRFKLRLLRYKALEQKDRIGTLVINPGGPGASGVEYAYNAQYIFSANLLQKYDIIGFDPRGVGESAPIKCLTDKETDASYAADSKPDSEKELDLLIQQVDEYAKKCESRTKNLANYATLDSAKDMDILRATLKEKKLNFLGVSYGTYLGTLYAQLFPQNVGRMVLDGAVNPNLDSEAENLAQAIGFDTALDAFISDCFLKKDCPLQQPLDKGRGEIIALFNSSATSPLKSSSGRAVTESLIVLGTASALYDPSSGWPRLRAGLREARTGNGTTLLALADDYSRRRSDGTYSTNETDAAFVIDCLDWRGARSTASIKVRAPEFVEKAPVFGPYLAYSGLSCQFLPATSPDAIREIVTTPIIIIGTTRDPATPYIWAQDLHNIFQNSRLISFEADGHTGYGQGSTCVDSAVDNYFLTGILPTSELTCKSPA